MLILIMLVGILLVKVNSCDLIIFVEIGFSVFIFKLFCVVKVVIIV